jgi:pyruvate kinase
MKINTDLKLLKYRRTKILATLGPASNETAAIEAMILAGADLFRLNMSHGTHDNHREIYARIRAAAEKYNRPVAVLADLCGPKIRVGRFKSGAIDLAPEAPVAITTRAVLGDDGLIPSQYAGLAQDVFPGLRILLDDGAIELEVTAVRNPDIQCRVVVGGVLKDHKGMNLPGAAVSAPSLTEEDCIDAHFALSLGVDLLALSFVRCAQDVEQLRSLVAENDKKIGIVAKIEKPEALDNIDEILTIADGIMVARGDLGVELPPQKVPIAQFQLIDRARAHRKPVIVATQMLESMITNPRPTRAEVSDVATAVRSGADAVMLSAETAAGSYPVRAVKMMDDIARQTEGYLWRQGAFGSLTRSPDAERPIPVEDALSESMAQLSRDLMVRAVIVISRQGRSMAVMSSSRPGAPVVGMCPDYRSCCIANLLWGVLPIHCDTCDIADPYGLARKAALDLGLAGPGQTILVVRGFSQQAETNLPSVTIVTV